MFMGLKNVRRTAQRAENAARNAAKPARRGGFFTKARQRVDQAAQSAQRSGAPAQTNRKRAGLLKQKDRVRFIEQPGAIVAQHERRKLFGWKPTGVREVVDLKRAAEAVRIAEARNGNTAGYGALDAMSSADTAGFWSKVKKAAKKIGKNKVVKVIAKAHSTPLKWAHKVTHGKNSPIRKAELAMQKTITKNLPILKPFVAVHNKIAGATHKVIEGKKPSKKDLPSPAEVKALAEANKRTKADAIAKALKKVPPAQQKAAKEHLIKKATSWVVQSPTTGITYNFKL